MASRDAKAARSSPSARSLCAATSLAARARASAAGAPASVAAVTSPSSPRSTTARIWSVSAALGSPPRATASPARRSAGIGPERGLHPRLPRVVGRERHEVGLGEVAVVVGFFLGAQRLGAPRRLVPVPSLLLDGAPRLEDRDLPGGLVLDRSTQRAQRVEVLHLASGAECSGPRGPDRDVGVDSHGALLHAAVGRARRHQDAPQLGGIGAGLGGRADVGLAHDLDQWHPRSVVVDQRVVRRVDPTARAHMRELARVLLHVGPRHPDPGAVGQLEPPSECSAAGRTG